MSDPDAPVRSPSAWSVTARGSAILRVKRRLCPQVAWKQTRSASIGGGEPAQIPTYKLLKIKPLKGVEL
jgi:hypothetical protein